MTVVGQFPRVVEEIENEWITLADGCRLAARIWRPADATDDPVPALLEYLPYRKRDGTVARDEQTHPYLAGHGYACVRVDMRGNGESDGLMEDEYTRQEHDDALEVIEWIAAQPWCTGKVGMMGISWGGFNALQVAARRPPALKAIVTLCSTDDRYEDDIHYLGGCVLGENLGWASTMFAYSSRPPDPVLVGGRWREMWLSRLDNMPMLAARWLGHAQRDDFWKHGSVCEDFADIEAAVYAVGGWADPYSNAIPRMLAGLEAPRKALIGPWVHLYPHVAVPEPRIGFLREMLRWWDRWLKDADTGIAGEPALRAWMQESARPGSVTGERAGRWIAEPAWPAPGVTPRRYALNAGTIDDVAKPETPLMVSSPQTVGLFCGEYFPLTLGAALPGDQRLEDAGSLLFDSAPLGERLEILGAAVVELDIESDRPQALVAVRLCEVFPDGASARVAFRALNLTHRDGHEAPEPLETGRRYRVRVQLNHTAHAFAPGNRIRIAVSTAYFPMVWPSPEPVTLTVHAGASSLELPVRMPQPADDALAPFAEPETSPPMAADVLREPGHHRVIETDVGTGVTTLRITKDSGAVRNRAHGLEAGVVGRETWTIHPDDPLSAKGETHWTCTLGRGDWQTRTETRQTMTADRATFHIHSAMEAFEGGERIFERRWDNKVPRDMV